MALTQKGLVDSIGAVETRQYNEKTYVSRSLVIEQPSFDSYTGEKRNSNYIKLEATKQELCDALNNFPVGTKVEVEFIVRGGKYEKKDERGKKTGVFDVFNRLELRAIALASASTGVQAPAGANPIPTAAPIPAASPAPAQATAAPASAPAGDFDPDLGF